MSVIDLVSSQQKFVVQAEQPKDCVAREALLDRAMGPGRKRKSSEKLRRGRLPSRDLALVARDSSGRVVGTVRLWDVAAGGKPLLLLGPLAVDPAHAGFGIGSALMRHAVSTACRLGHGGIVLVGDSAYYKKFGFSAAKTDGLMMPGPVERERFLALELRHGYLEVAAGLLVAMGPVSQRRSSGGQKLKQADVRAGLA